MESEFEEDDPHFAFGDEFEEEMDKFWLDEKPVRQDEIDNLFEEEEDFEEGDGEEWGVEGLENLDASEQEAVDQVMNEEEDEALLAEEVALLQALQEEKGPEKLLLDSTNVDKLINMLSRVRLAWPENLPGYDATEYATDPERAKFPSTFYQNTDKEKTVLWHAENFRRQFQAQFPRRRALVIAPKNECGTQKLFPTFINPCVLGYPEFLDALTCAEFFKEFFAPELMEHPTRAHPGARYFCIFLKLSLKLIREILSNKVEIKFYGSYKEKETKVFSFRCCTFMYIFLIQFSETIT
ncbi:coiled-coil domain-containing protein lobo-like [Folsomia candida]|uniref:coiled-coil domain-containing protein lobo-like n=1 Tax=Folsomia candida TaxID=158441 RepID=UPI0016051B41|nr:coiled-coil domain-containing protein lobo-like [Folsomia candida]